MVDTLTIVSFTHLYIKPSSIHSTNLYHIPSPPTITKPNLKDFIFHPSHPYYQTTHLHPKPTNPNPNYQHSLNNAPPQPNPLPRPPIHHPRRPNARHLRRHRHNLHLAPRENRLHRHPPRSHLRHLLHRPRRRGQFRLSRLQQQSPL